MNDRHKIFEEHDLNFNDKNIFKSVKHAKKIISKVASEFFADENKSVLELNAFENFMRGIIKPKFINRIEDIRYYPDILNGFYEITVLVSDSDSNEIKFEKWNKTLGAIQPSTGDFFVRNITRIYLTFYSEEEKDRLNSEVEKELAKEANKSNNKNNIGN